MQVRARKHASPSFPSFLPSFFPSFLHSYFYSYSYSYFFLSFRSIEIIFPRIFSREKKTWMNLGSGSSTRRNTTPSRASRSKREETLVSLQVSISSLSLWRCGTRRRRRRLRFEKLVLGRPRPDQTHLPAWISAGQAWSRASELSQPRDTTG